MEEKMKENREAIMLILLLILFFKYIIGFFAEGGDKSPIALILFNLIIILALISLLLYREKILKINNDLFKQTKLDKYFKINKG